MRLILFRHGPADHRDAERWPNDRLRPLTERGAARTRASARGLAKIEQGVTRILSSPLTRALETARIVAEELEVPRVTTLESLSPDGSFRKIIESLANADADEVVVLIGHEPDLGKLAGTLVFGAPRALPLKKAGACAIAFPDRIDPGTGELAWSLPPRILRHVGHRKAKV